MTDTDTDKARVDRLIAYSQIIAKARKRLKAICNISEHDLVRYVREADTQAMDGLIELEHALEDLNT